MQGLKQAILTYWSGLSLREQRMLVIALSFGLVAAIYWGGVAPLKQQSENAQLRLSSEKQLLSWVKDQADTITQLRKTSNAPRASSVPLNQLLSSSTSRYGIELIRLQPRDEMVQVWVQPLSFNKLMNWLVYLRQEQGIDVAFFDINETDNAGIVEVKRLQFKRAGN